MAPEIHLK